MAAKNLHVKKGDVVMIIAGKEKGKSGKVMRILSAKGRLTVEGLNVVKRHSRPSRGNQEGGIIEKEAPLDASNVQFLCGECRKPTRTGIRELEDGSKVRYCKKCNEIVDK